MRKLGFKCSHIVSMLYALLITYHPIGHPIRMLWNSYMFSFNATFMSNFLFTDTNILFLHSIWGVAGVGIPSYLSSFTESSPLAQVQARLNSGNKQMGLVGSRRVRPSMYITMLRNGPSITPLPNFVLFPKRTRRSSFTFFLRAMTPHIRKSGVRWSDGCHHNSTTWCPNLFAPSNGRSGSATFH